MLAEDVGLNVEHAGMVAGSAAIAVVDGLVVDAACEVAGVAVALVLVEPVVAALTAELAYPPAVVGVADFSVCESAAADNVVTAVLAAVAAFDLSGLHLFCLHQVWHYSRDDVWPCAEIAEVAVQLGVPV